MVKHHNYNRNPKHLAALALSLLLLVSIVLVQGSLLLVFAQTSDTDDKHFVSDPSYSTETAKAIEKANGGKLSGDVIHTVMVSNPGYGYVGMNANNVKVGTEPGSAASKNLRKALATIIAVYRDVAVDSYYGEFANVIHYPISDTSWAAPKPTDPGYRQAFSVDVEGSPIYTSGMNAQQRYDAAK